MYGKLTSIPLSVTCLSHEARIGELRRRRILSTVGRALQELARSERRDEADGARGMLLSLEGWTSEAFGMSPGLVRHWRNRHATGGVEALRGGGVARKAQAVAA